MRAILCGVVLFSLAGLGAADSPVGTWELTAKESGEQYNGYITFKADFTYSGYCIRTGTRDLSLFDGFWAVDGKSLAASISLTVDGETFTGSVESKFTAGKSIKGKLFYDDGDIATFSAVPFSAPPPLAATYSLTGKIGNSAVADTRPLNKDLFFSDVYNVPVRASSAEASADSRATVNKGRAIVNSKGTVFLLLDTTDETFTTRVVSLVGKVNKRDGSLKLRGAKGVRASLKLVKNGS